jgi:hypothetical protein
MSEEQGQQGSGIATTTVPVKTDEQRCGTLPDAARQQELLGGPARARTPPGVPT